MKRLFLVVACALLLVAPAGATTFDYVYLTNWPATAWSTNTDGGFRYALGVSDSDHPAGPLFGLDGSGKVQPLLEVGNVYYLYAGNLNADGTSPLGDVSIDIYTDYVNQGGGSPRIYGGFHFQGTSPGTFQVFDVNQAWYYGSTGGIPLPALYLGWAQGTANMVSPNAFTPDGVNDIYLVLGIGVKPTLPNPIPLPGAVWLLGSGLLGLGGISHWRRRRS